MTINEELKIFFEQKIFDLDEDDVDTFLIKYSDSTIFKNLFDKLKLVSVDNDDEQAWLLGRIFGDMSKCKNADKNIYNLLNTKNTISKGVIFSCLSGYWDQADSDISVIVDLLNTIEREIIREKIWSEREIISSILSVAIGYANNKKYIESKIPNNSFQEQFERFEIYLSNVCPNSPASKLIRKEILAH
ncbi:MAG: hypothetical protein ACRC2S_29240 [Waterburya sp.]